MTRKPSPTKTRKTRAPGPDAIKRTEHSNSEAEVTPPANAGSKAATVIALLQRDGGATLDEMIAATGWQKHSVRGFMAGTLKKRYGLTVSSAKIDQIRRYSVACEPKS